MRAPAFAETTLVQLSRFSCKNQVVWAARERARSHRVTSRTFQLNGRYRRDDLETIDDLDPGELVAGHH
jgi:hypothetical protein